MAVTYGFYDSLNHDRLYNAQQMSAIFDGIINDGVFMSVGNQFHTVAGTGMQVIVKSGRAWFDSTWTLNDAEYPLSIDAADVLLTRIDAVVLEVNSEVATRANTIKVVKGTPASTPAKPTLTNTATIHQHALAYVTVAKNITAITNSMIEIVVGKTETPYVTAILQTTDITDLYNQWEDYFQTWFDTVRSTLDGDVALNLQNQITTLERKLDSSNEVLTNLSNAYNTTKNKVYVKGIDAYGSLVPFFNISVLSKTKTFLKNVLYFSKIDRYVGTEYIYNSDDNVTDMILRMIDNSGNVISSINIYNDNTYKSEPIPMYASDTEIIYVKDNGSTDKWDIYKVSVTKDTLTSSILSNTIAGWANMSPDELIMQCGNVYGSIGLGCIPWNNGMGFDTIHMVLYNNNNVTEIDIPSPPGFSYNIKYGLSTHQINNLLFISTISYSRSYSDEYIYFNIYNLSTKAYLLSDTYNTRFMSSNHPTDGSVSSSFRDDVSYAYDDPYVYIYYKENGYIKVNINTLELSVVATSLFDRAINYKNYYMYSVYNSNMSDVILLYSHEPNDINGAENSRHLLVDSLSSMHGLKVPDTNSFRSLAIGSRQKATSRPYTAPLYADNNIGIDISRDNRSHNFNICILSESLIVGGVVV